MIISPPFLPERPAGQSDAAWLDVAMQAPRSRLADTQAPEGAFPLSHNLSWHNGMHLQAPTANGRDLPVRAIADGTVVFASAPTAHNDDITHPLNYNPFNRAGEQRAAWTDNGCLIIEHRTSLGASGGAETEFVFYSVYMHLSELGRTTPAGGARRPWQANDPIRRKDEVGTPGRIYGDRGQIHFEICFDANNLQRLTGRAPRWQDPATPTAPAADGRTDVIFGSLYVYVPAGAAADAGDTMPASHLRPASPAQRLDTPVWVKITYEQGGCTLETFDMQGTPLGALAEADASAEYNLTAQARARHEALPEDVRRASSISAWHELLRFGRNIGSDPEQGQRDALPLDVAHWRRVALAEGRRLWLDLNATGSFKFSDADFLPFLGWNCIDDDTRPDDQRCDSERIKLLIADPDPSNAARLNADELARRLGNARVQRKLALLFCRFPSEWNKSTAASRYDFVRQLPLFETNPDAWPQLLAHLEALAFDALPSTYLNADWRAHPRVFVQTLMRVGWLSRDELSQIYPRTPEAVREQYRNALNVVARKYLFTSNGVRLSHFLGQGSVESSRLTVMQELSMSGRVEGAAMYGQTINPSSRTPERELGHWYGAIPAEDDPWFRSTKYNSRGVRIASTYNWRNGNLGDPDAQKFRGRGFKQLTGRLNYCRYWVYRGWLDPATFDDNWWTDPQYRAQNEARMRLRAPTIDDPERATATSFNCMDTGGWYLGSERPDTLAVIDRDRAWPATSATDRASERTLIARVTLAINGGDIGLEERLSATRVAKEVLL